MSRVSHFEVGGRNPEKLIDFYSKVLGWEFNKWEGPMEYWMIKTGDEKTPGIDGGLGRGEPVKRVVNTIEIGDLEATLGKVIEHGGKVLQPKGPIMGVGWFASFEDPEGNQFGLMQGDPDAK